MKGQWIPYLLLLLALLAGCGKHSSAGFSESDLYLTVGENPYRCMENIETVIEQLGDGYGYAEGKSCAYDGLDKTYTYETAQFFTNPLDAGDLVSEIYTESPEVATSKGLAVGAAKEAVRAAYGEPAAQDGTVMVYRASEEAGEPALCFDLEGDTVAAIFLTTEAV